MDEAIKASIKDLVLSCDGVESATWDNAPPDVLKLNVNTHLPQDFEAKGVSNHGVMAIEPVRLVFSDRYPFVAPYVVLRDDFPRSFPHINPSLKHVLPCIYEGNLTELLQQSGLESVIFQLVSWLRKAAADDLMDLAQGWEWMRNDDCKGILKGNFKSLRETILDKPFKGVFCACVLSNCPNDTFGACLLPKKWNACEHGNNSLPCFIYAPPQENVISDYHPNKVTNVQELKEFFITHIGAGTFDGAMTEIAKQKGIGRFIAVAVVRRPIHLINTNTNLEVLPFLINVKRTGKKHVSLQSPVFLLGTSELCSPALMRQVSGHQPEFRGRIIQLGCGSLGSKLSLHLLRNGLPRICFVDTDVLSSHNMARHALTWGSSEWFKSLAMASTASLFGVEEFVGKNDYVEAATTASAIDLIVDSTASLTVRNRLTLGDVKARVVHTALYGKMEHQCGICFIEGSDRNPRVDDMCFRFMRANVLEDIGVVDYTAKNLERHTYGQGCSSLTMKVDDATISLLAAGMAHRVQKYIDSGFPDTGDCGYGRTEDGESVRWERLDMGKTIVLPGVRDDGYQVRILSCAKDEMDRLAESAHERETGGYLIGAIVSNTKTITVVACLPPPLDSRATPTEFVLGVDGMRNVEATINEKSNSVFCVIGTWHTHPMGGCASITDWETYDKIFKKRKCPTLCLIWTLTGIKCLPEIKRR